MSTTLDISPNRFWKGLMLVLFIIVMIVMMGGCKTKRVVSASSSHEKTDIEQIDKVDATRTSELEEEKETVTEKFGGYLIGSVPINLSELISSGDTAAFVLSGDGVDVDIKVSNGSMEYKAKAKPTKRTTEIVKKKRKDEETEKRETERTEKSKKSTEEKIKSKVKSGILSVPWWIYLLITLGLLYGAYRVIK